MSFVGETTPAKDSTSQVNEELSVGEDLDFQRRWWKFEHAVWIFFACVIVLDLCGVFGQGPLAKAHRQASDGSMRIQYERVERTETPSMVTVDFGPSAIHNGQAELFLSESFVRDLGVQRIIPAPLQTEIGKDGLTYRFPASSPPAKVQLALQPNAPGVFHFMVQVPGAQPVHAKVVVMP